MKHKVIENPVNGERVAFLLTGEETQGEKLLARVELRPGGKVPMHFHTTFEETLEVEEGVLGITVNGQERKLRKGESVTFHKREHHRFFNDGNETVTFLCTNRPARTFMEAAIIGDMLSHEGKANKDGLPKNILHLAVIYKLTESYLSAMPLFLQKIIFWPLIKLAETSGVEKKLRAKYLD